MYLDLKDAEVGKVTQFQNSSLMKGRKLAQKCKHIVLLQAAMFSLLCSLVFLFIYSN